MAVVGNILPSLYKPNNLGKFILDFAFRDCALILNQSRLLMSDKMVGTFPAPLIGFSYDSPDSITFMDFQYCEYPYLNKTMIVNSLVKNNSSISLKAYRPITKANSVIANMMTNMTLIKALETYAMRGGTFTLTTMWGIINDLVLERVSGIKVENEIGGVGFQFDLKKINFALMNETAQMSSKLSNLASGGV